MFAVHPMMIFDNGENDDRTFGNASFKDGSFFRCKSNDLISVIARCDEVIDCFDASDELDCRDEKGK
jgi:hypothetical protein